MSFRPATMGVLDAAFLHALRKWDEAEPWYEGPSTDYDTHCRWLRDRIDSPLCSVLIWENEDRMLGAVRCESNGEVAFGAVNDYVAVEMLRALASTTQGKLKATVDADDPKADLLVKAGFAEYPVRFLAYKS